MTTDTITIGGREFRVGATYAPRRPGKTGPRNRTFLGGAMHRDVAYRDHAGVTRTCWCMTWWEWAGDEVAP